MPDLHRRASVWHERQGLVAEAIEHALAAPDLERAAALIEEGAEATLARSEITTLLSWVRRLPDEMVRSRPTLCFFHAWALLMSGGSLDSIEQSLHDIACAGDERGGSDEAVDDVLAGRMAALRGYLNLLQGDMPGAAELCRRALAHLPESDLFVRNIVTWILSLARLFDEDPREVGQALQAVIQMGQDIDNRLVTVTALCYEAKLQTRQGRLYQAQEILDRAMKLATDAHGRRLPIASEALMGLGELKRQWNDLEAAAGLLGESLELARQWSELSAFDAYFPLARTRLAQGDVEAAR
ncbi:MAG: tetratricopeptide repeat protein, partial [Anaerolineae bacterium]|nr:tetratricopeptide repeat protein [Anaerolineae bacterium]